MKWIWVSFAFIVSVSCAAPTDDGKTARNISQLPLRHQHSLTWETYWVDSGHVETNQATIELPFDPLSQPYDVIHSQKSRRRKRIIYGDDDRVRIDPAEDGKKFPYSAEMRVSTGCSGIMVSSRHVLTAAHCVHDGSGYLASALYFLRAGYLEKDGGTKWFFVRRFYIPSQWKNMTSDNHHAYGNWDDYDVAILEMVDDMGGQRDFIPPGLSGMFCEGNKKTLHGAGTKVEFVSFPDDKSIESLWYVLTDIDTESPTLIYFHGDAWHGCSGAGMYAWDYNEKTGKYERRTIGVLSGNRNTEDEASIQGNYNVAARLNPVNFMMVCHWVGIEDECKQRYARYLEPSEHKDLCG